MAHTAFKYDEAIEIADDFEDLIDTDFSINALTYFIENVLVSPYTEEDKTLFLSNFRVSRDKEGATGFYKGDKFDVIVLAYDVDDESSFIHIDIQTFVKQMGITYHFP